MNLDWDRLRILDAVARNGSVTRAAEYLHMTGPAVSQQLRRIETETHARIVEPDGRGIRLTSDGQLLADYAGRMHDLMQEAENQLQGEADRISTIHVAALASLVRTHLGDSISRFTAAHPRTQVTITDGETHHHIEALLRGTVDLVVAESWSSSPLLLPAQVTATPIIHDDTVLALPAGSADVDLTDEDCGKLSESIWVTCERDSHPHRALLQFARSRGFEPDIRFYVADHTTQLALVRSMGAVALLPATAEVLAAPGISFTRPLADVHREILLLTCDRTLPTAVTELAEVLVGSTGS